MHLRKGNELNSILFKGENERESCYRDTMQILCECFPHRENRSAIEVLVPGAGLGRLVWELVIQGFSVQGNEFSILMLLTSNLILNKCKQVFLTERVIYFLKCVLIA